MKFQNINSKFLTACVLTLNEYTPEELDQLNNLEATKIEYAIFGKEVGPENGIPHIQGYIKFKKQIRGSSLLKMLPTRSAVDKAKGNAYQNYIYCSKGGDFTEIGERPVEKVSKRGKRSDLEEVRKIVQEKGMRGVVEVCDNYQQIKVAEKILQYSEEPRDWETEVIWLYGAPGAGKSKKARELLLEKGYDKRDIYTKNTGTKWFGRYDAHPAVILDDFRPSWWPMTDMLGMLDRYEYTVEAKGSERQFKPKVVVVTSVRHPVLMYQNMQEKYGDEPIEQLTRRINIIEEVGVSAVTANITPDLVHSTQQCPEEEIRSEMTEEDVLSSFTQTQDCQKNTHNNEKVKEFIFKRQMKAKQKVFNYLCRRPQRRFKEILKDVKKWPSIEEVKESLKTGEHYPDDFIVWLPEEDYQFRIEGKNVNCLTKSQAKEYIEFRQRLSN